MERERKKKREKEGIENDGTRWWRGGKSIKSELIHQEGGGQV